MSVSVASLEAQIEDAKKRIKEYQILKRLQNGEEEPGSYPEIVAQAVKRSLPIPLKYTHSYQGLKALYKYSLDAQDTQLHIWTRDQINLILSPSTLEEFNKEIPRKNQLLVPENTPRRQFLSFLKNPDFNQLCIINSKCPKDSFWEQQISRLINVNSRLWKVQPQEGNHFRSAFQILEFSFLNEAKVQKSSPLNSDNFITALKVKPSTYVPALIYSYAQKNQWKSLETHKYFVTKQLLTYKFHIDTETLRLKLELCNAPEEVLALLPKK